jgi:hypothetical protein
MIAWMLPPKSWVLPAYHRSISFAFLGDGLDVEPVGVDDLAVEDEVGAAVGLRARERVVEVRGFGGEDVDHLVDVVVRGGLGQSEASPQVRDIAFPPKPCESEDGLPERREGPSAFSGPPGPPVGGQESGDEPDEFPGDVEDGTIGSHAESFAGSGV